MGFAVCLLSALAILPADPIISVSESWLLHSLWVKPYWIIVQYGPKGVNGGALLKAGESML